MKASAYLLAGLAFLAATSCVASDAETGPRQRPDALFAEIARLDSAVFDSFNHCSSPQELQRHARFFAPDVEFYHDTGGVTWNRADMIANTGKFACGHYRRELVQGSLRVFPVKEFGAIEQGVHRFCRIDDGDCEGLADFVIVWRQVDGRWQITRVLSYGHRANDRPQP
jgi:hypothetical protein